ncbi:MAG: homogentisate 1,2-dioxygenase [Proteobacteria bacterium]|nr:homogentisate 1,2-dioxygenase [Pseudomonadota bacterium]
MIPWIKGQVSRQAHVDLPPNTFEEEYARSGFSGKYAHLYRSAPPVGWTHIEGDLKPRAYDIKLRSIKSQHLLEGRMPLLGNQDVVVSIQPLDKPMSYFFRNADSDELYFAHKGSGRLETDFGPLTYETGDYLYIPRGTVYRLDPKTASEFLLIESASEFQFPDKGMLGQHALFDPAVLEVPDPSLGVTTMTQASSYELKIQREGQITTVHYPFCPINTIGWKGTLSVWKLNVRDIRPISSDRYHLPPSAHTTLVAKNFVVCSFLPRPLENGDPKAMKVPFYHSNIDYDEVLFYHAGDFFSRSGISHGMLTFHPQGIHHGPHPKAIARTNQQQNTNEIAVMIDTRYPLKRLEQSNRIEIEDYWKSWM